MERGYGRVIRELREAAHFSQSELAKRIGWDKSRLCKYETNQLGMTAEVIEAIARALGHHPLHVIMRCLTLRYQALNSNSQIGRLARSLIKELHDR